MPKFGSIVARRLEKAHSVEDLRQLARRQLPRMVFDFVDGAAQSESTAKENRAAIERLKLVPGPIADVRTRDLGVSLFGRRSALPLIIGPTGFAGMFWRDGDQALARAAAAFDVPFVMSHGANMSLANLRKVAPDARHWFQMYLPLDRDRWLPLVSAVDDLGFEALEVTVDTALPGRRLRDLRNGFGMPMRWTASKLFQLACRPAWTAQMAIQGMPSPVIIKDALANGARHATVSDLMATQINPSVTWQDLERLRDLWKRPLVLKGVVNPRDVERAARAGFDGVVISNHGGRQLDGAVSSIEMLPDCVTAGARRIQILIDSGFRSGTDILKALALGADAVQVGRATLFGLAAGGQAGVEHALKLFATELDAGMTLAGITAVTQAQSLEVRGRPVGGDYPPLYSRATSSHRLSAT